MCFIKCSSGLDKPIKTVLVFICFLSVQLVFSQIPDGYYDNAQGLTGDNLKAALHDIIKGHTEYPYSSSGTDVWDILKDADRDPNNSNNVIGIYSNFSMDGPAEFDNNAGWNREHVWAKSRGDFGTTPGAGTDTHHIRAADVSTNSARSNRNFDNATEQYVDGSGNYSGVTDSYTSSSEFIWEPRDGVKGDVARMIFYMTVRYEGDSGEPDLELTESLLSNTDKSPLHGKMSTLLAWHLIDPVSTEEQNRNDIIYGYQNNRNPFIDHPEYVCQIYTCSDGGNGNPLFTSTPITTATEGIVYTYSIVTTDNEGDAMIISGTTVPSWLMLTDNGGGSATLTGTPSSSDVGNHTVILSVADGNSSTTQSFTINVNEAGGGNNEPVFSSSPVTSAIEDQQYTYDITSTDSDGDNMTISATTKPSWLSFTDNGSGSATLSGTPTSSEIGSHNVELSVTDGTDNTTQSFTINVSAADGSSDAFDLFFSEYIEGSSFNKGLEVANFTGSSVDLSIYSIQKQTNGAGDWGSELALSGNLVQGDVFVVANSSADDIMLDQADIVTGSGAVTFNGNDAVGLFKNGTLIDIIGVFDNGDNFAQNTTLVRNANVNTPNTTYTSSEWTSHGSDTFSFLGSHTFGGDVVDPCDVPDGLSASNITSSSADLTWSGANGAQSYNLRYRIVGNTNWTVSASTTASFTVSGLDFNSDYEFQAQSVCTGSTSDFSTSMTFTTLAGNCAVVSGLSTTNITTSSVDLNWSASSGAISYNVEYKPTNNSSWVSGTSNTISLSVNGLTAGVDYEFRVQSVCSGGNADFSSAANFTTLAPTRLNDLFISEYIEGSSQNRALEIVNITGGDVDLTNYSFKKQTDGQGDWGSELLLSGTLKDQDVFVLASSSASNDILAETDQTTSSDFISFDGNDPVGLFKNDVLIDVVGQFGAGTADFGRNQTLVRKPDIETSSDVYSAEEWSFHDLDDLSDIGQHTLTGGTIPVITSLSNTSKLIDAYLFPNPADGSISLSMKLNTPDQLDIKIYNMSGKVVHSIQRSVSGNFYDEKIDLTAFPQGFYLLKVNGQNGTLLNRKFSNTK